MSGSATFATERLRFATPATMISAARTSPARAGAAAVSSRCDAAVLTARLRTRRLPLALIIALAPVAGLDRLCGRGESITGEGQWASKRGCASLFGCHLD